VSLTHTGSHCFFAGETTESGNDSRSDLKIFLVMQKITNQTPVIPFLPEDGMYHSCPSRKTGTTPAASQNAPSRALAADRLEQPPAHDSQEVGAFGPRKTETSRRKRPRDKAGLYGICK
jgi:hypothetical protein